MHEALPRVPDEPRPAPYTARQRCLAALLLLAGLCLRVYFVRRRAFIAGDSLLYQDIALNWLHAHVYGLSTDVAPRPTLIRLPGYPAILAALSWIFDRWLRPDPGDLRGFLPVLWLQVIADLGTCWIASRLSRRLSGVRAGMAALALACLCPFTANYTAVPLTETFTLFFLTLTFLAFAQWIELRRGKQTYLLAVAMACSILLRPDQGLLAAAVLPVLVLAGRSKVWFLRLRPAMLCAVLIALPFVPWMLRNLRTFHVVQPLAPKLANDPGEIPPIGFQRWYRTWAADFSSTEDAYWKYPEETVRPGDLPDRAFDNSQERTRAVALLLAAGVTHKLNPQIEANFTQLAKERARRHPMRTYVGLPLARLANMLFHPRDEMLPIAERWWQYRLHPAQTIFAWSYALLGAAYFVLGLAGLPCLWRTHRMLALAMTAYVVLRCLLLLTLDNAEQRYTLEFFPVVFIAAAPLFATPNTPALRATVRSTGEFAANEN